MLLQTTPVQMPMPLSLSARNSEGLHHPVRFLFSSVPSRPILFVAEPAYPYGLSLSHRNISFPNSPLHETGYTILLHALTLHTFGVRSKDLFFSRFPARYNAVSTEVPKDYRLAGVQFVKLLKSNYKFIS